MSTSTPNPVLVSIEGLIGSGKSTLIEHLKKRNPTWHFIDEPVGTWLNLKDASGKNLLEHFYNDKERYSYTFQNCALLSRAINIQKVISAWQEECKENPELTKHNVFVTERCLETDYHVFAKMLYDDGKMTLLEWDLYKMWYDYICKISYPLTKVVYVDTPPTLCKDRIGIRGRKGEEGIPLEYLVSLEKYQKQWLFADTNHKTMNLFSYINHGPEEQQHDVEDVEEYITIDNHSIDLFERAKTEALKELEIQSQHVDTGMEAIWVNCKIRACKNMTYKEYHEAIQNPKKEFDAVSSAAQHILKKMTDLINFLAN